MRYFVGLSVIVGIGLGLRVFLSMGTDVGLRVKLSVGGSFFLLVLV